MTETVLHRFGGAGDGTNPQGGDVVFDQAGNIYGTTIGGGAFGEGTVFELTKSSGGWTERVLYSFSGQADGGNPAGGLVFDQEGNLYGTTAGGGEGNGVIFELTPSGSGWQEKVLYVFTDSGDGALPTAGLTLSDAGQFFGTTFAGGSGDCLQGHGSPLVGCGVVFSGFGNTIYSFNAPYQSAPLSGPRAPITINSAGNLYGTTWGDGAFALGNVFVLSAGTYAYTSLHDFTGRADGGQPFSNVVIDSSGHLYGTASSGGSTGAGVVWEITP